MSRTRAEFSPDFFRGLFGSSTEDWKDFLEVSIRAVRDSQAQLAEAVAGEDLQAISEARHSIGPSLTQWGAVSLESSLRELGASNLKQWPALSDEFDVMLEALDALFRES